MTDERSHLTVYTVRGTLPAMPGCPPDRPSSLPVVHALGRAEWASVGDAVRPPSLQTERFVHLSTTAQIAGVATALFHGRTDLVLLVVDPDRLPLPLVWEDCYESGRDFPHLYAALPVAAVTAVLDYAPGPDGVFTPPTLD
ncbi:DUF952 domain-containing protein [soil metagenome]